MNKSLSPTAGSAASSETSETLSISDESLTPTKQGTTKNWKKIKEISEKDDKRPPWRMVSVSTLPKADKNAMLRAKLLDASRRMRAGKNQVGVQTDNIPTKLMKEISTEVSSDLVPMVDEGITTEGTITFKQDGPGEFILTHSVAQMTEGIRMHEVQTQTATPRISNSFFQKYYHKKPKQLVTQDLDDNLTKNEEKLIEQIRDIREIDRQLKKKYQYQTDYYANQTDETDLSDDSLFDAGKNSLSNYKLPKQFTNIKSSEIVKPTLSSWQFDFSDDEENDLPTLPRRPYSEGYKPWNSFKDLVIGRKLANMKLSPIPVRKQSLKKKSVTWSDAQHNAVADLINEANALLDVFDQMSIMLGPDLQLNELPKKDNTEIKFLSEYWEPILNESHQILERKLSNLKNPKIRRAEPLMPEVTDIV